MSEHSGLLAIFALLVSIIAVALYLFNKTQVLKISSPTVDIFLQAKHLSLNETIDMIDKIEYAKSERIKQINPSQIG